MLLSLMDAIACKKECRPRKIKLTIASVLCQEMRKPTIEKPEPPPAIRHFFLGNVSVPG